MKNRIFTILTLLTLLLVSVIPFTAQDATECEDGLRLFEHFAGETCIPDEPQRVVTLQDQNGLLPIWELGFRNIVGSGGSFRQDGEPFFRRMAEQGFDPQGVAFVGGWSEPNLESILELEPDLIVGVPFHEEIYDQLSAIAPTVLIDTFGEASFEEVMMSFGELIGMEEAVTQLDVEYRQGIADLVAAVDDPSEIVISVIETAASGGAEPGQFYISGNANTSIETVLREAGFARPAPQLEATERTYYSVESIREHDADLLLRFTFISGDAEDEQRNTEAVLGSPLWGLLNAVEKGQAFDLSGEATFGFGYTVRLTFIDNLMPLLEDLDTSGDLSTVDIAVPEPMMDDDSVDAECMADERAVEHTVGVTCVPEQPLRVATNVETAVTALLLLGVQPVAGPEDQAGWNAPYVSLLPDNVDINDIADIGITETTSFESLLLTEPDMILTYPYAGEEIYEELSSIAPTVLIERGANGDWRERFDREAAALNRETEAAEVIARYEAALTEMSEFTDLTIAFVRRPNNGTFRMDVVGSFPGSVMEDAGLNLLTAPDGVGEQEFVGLVDNISEERMDILQEADLIITPDWREAGFSEEPDLAGLERLVGWDLLPAVQAGNVLVVPGPVYNGGNYAAAQLLLEAIQDAVADME